MASRSETAALVALLRRGRRPWQEYADLLEEAGSVRAVLEDELASGPSQASLLEDDLELDALIEEAADDVGRWKSQGLRLLTLLDRDYPENLRAAHDRPPMIFVAGDLEQRDRRSVAVVGARKASPGGIVTARAIAEHLAACEYTVVSGLAIGIDSAAHAAALEQGGRTVAVIGTGLTRCYPPQNAALQRRIAREGAVISQFWPDAPPRRQSFPMRNAVMSGLTLATVVVEGSERSGSSMQTRLALGQGRPVLLPKSLLAQQWASECAERPGTHVFSSPSELIAVLERLTSSETLVA